MEIFRQQNAAKNGEIGAQTSECIECESCKESIIELLDCIVIPHIHLASMRQNITNIIRYINKTVHDDKYCYFCFQ